MPGCTDPGGTVNGKTRVLVTVSHGLSGVNPHSNLDLYALRPSVRKERQLRLNGSEHRVARAREGHEKRVPLSVDLVTAMSGECCPQEALVVGEHERVAIAQLLDQTRRPLNVREEKRDSPAW
jgi:hypothetical protein